MAPGRPNRLSRSINVSDYTLDESSMKSLEPNQMVDDSIVNHSNAQAGQDLTVVSVFWYTTLCGEQEGKNRRNRDQRNQEAEQYFRTELLDRDYIFIPISRKYVLLMDSMTYNATNRKEEFDIINSYLRYLQEKKDPNKTQHKREELVLKVPQQKLGSNNCGIYVPMFLENFSKEIQDFENNPTEYAAKTHKWFCHEDAEKKRAETKSFLQNLFDTQDKQHGLTDEQTLIQMKTSETIMHGEVGSVQGSGEGLQDDNLSKQNDRTLAEESQKLKDQPKIVGCPKESDEGQIEKLREDVNQLNQENKKLTEDNEKLIADNQQLRANKEIDNKRSNEQIQELQRDISKLRKENERLKKTAKERSDEQIQELKHKVSKLIKDVEWLKVFVAGPQTIIEKIQDLQKKSPEKMLTEGKQEIDALKNMFNNMYKMWRQYLQQKGVVCRMDCGLSCLFLVCLENNIDLDQRYLEKIIVACYVALENLNASEKNKNLNVYEKIEKLDVPKRLKQTLCCNNFTKLLTKLEILIEVEPEQGTTIWQELMKRKNMMMVGRVGQGKPGHLICALKDNETEDQLKVFDYQKNQRATWTMKEFEEFKGEKSIKLYTIDLDLLRKIIEKFKSEKVDSDMDILTLFEETIFIL